VRLENGGEIQATASNTGNAGAIDVRAEGGQIRLTQNAAIFSTTTFENPGGGDGGEIRLTAGTIEVRDTARISAESTGTGNAGSIQLTTTGTFRLTQDTQILSRTSFAGSGGGAGGEIRLTARAIELHDTARISAESTSTGNAGSIQLTATDTFLNDHGSVTTSAARSQGGAIQVTAQTMVRLRQGEITTSVTGGDERAGNITIDPEFVILEGSQITANAVGGPGGNITITAGAFLADPTSAVTASSARNINGEINIRAPVQNISGVVAPLSQNFVPTTVLLSDQCVARLRAGTVSSLVTRGPEGLPASPEGLLPGRYYEASPASLATTPSQLSRPETKTSSMARLDIHNAGQLRLQHTPVPGSRPGTWQLQCPR
jgi:hypothetical protein